MLLLEIFILLAFIVVVALALYKNFYPFQLNHSIQSNNYSQPLQHTIIIHDNPYVVDNYPYRNLHWYPYSGDLNWVNNQYIDNYSRDNYSRGNHRGNHHSNHHSNHHNNHHNNHHGGNTHH
jgi:hypothetical protein